MRPGRNEAMMSLESIVMLVISVLMIVYLLYALLRPEKF
jgi:K+-transporting ATPase KdpF subunit